MNENKKKLEQKQLLNKMEQEIRSLEFKIKHYSLINKKISIIKNLKIGAKALQLLTPYALTAGIVAGVFTVSGNTPFYSGDEHKAYLNVMTEFDNIGNVRYEQQYDSFENSENKIYYYTKWHQNGDGLYSRTVQIYSIKKKNCEDIIELFGQEDIKLEDIFGKPISTIKETKNNLTEEELQEESFVKATIYNKDKNDYIIYKETVRENVLLSILYIIVTVLSEFIILFFRKKNSFEFLNYVDKIKKNHQSLDIETITKKLELKKDNYNRMVR